MVSKTLNTSHTDSRRSYKNMISPINSPSINYENDGYKTINVKEKIKENSMSLSKKNMPTNNPIYMFAGEKVKVQAHCATKTHLICNVNVCFFMSTRYTYEKLKSELTEKYGDKYVEAHKVEENKGYVPYVTDYCQWFVDQDTLTGKSNTIILSKCDYRSSAPLVISYIDAKNSHIDTLEIKSDF